MATSNSLEWILKIKDLASGVSDKVNASLHKTKDTLDNVNAGAVKMASSASKALNSLYSKAQTAVKGSDFLNASVEELKSRLEEVNKVRVGTVLKSEFNEASKEAKALENQIKRLEQGISGSGIGAKIAGWRKDFASSLPGANLIKNPLALAGATVGGFWKATMSAMEAGKEKVRIQTLVGSAEIGEALYDGITKFATDTVFGDELYGVAAQMLGYGIDQSEVLPIMKQLGDISQGDAQKLDSLSLAFSQASSLGKLMGQDFNQMVNAGFNPLAVISKKTGESIESLRNRMEKGLISIDEVKGAMTMATSEGGDFYNMLEDIANTPYGKLQKFIGGIREGFKTIGEVFTPLVSTILDGLNWINEKAGAYIKPVAATIGLLSVVLLGVAVAQWAFTSAIWANTAALLANPITWIVVAIAALIAVIVSAINKYHEWGAAILLLMGPLGMVVNLIMALKNNWESIKEAFSEGGILAGLKRIGVVLLDAVLYPVQQLLNMLAKIPGLSKLAKGGADRIAAIRKNLDLVDPEGKKNKVEDPRGVIRSDGTSTVDTSGATQTNESIVTGGTRNTTINMTIGNIVETLNLKAQDLKEGAQQTQDELAAALLRALAMATTTAG